jgi:hypothetical protein
MRDIRRVLDWHQRVAEKGVTGADYELMIRGRSKLAAAMEYLGQAKAAADHDEIAAGYRRRRQRDTLVLLYSADHTQGVAQAKARIETKPLDEDHAAARKVKLELAALWDTVKETLNAMAGEIRALEQEQKLANYASA